MLHTACNSPPQPRLKRPFLEPAVDTPQKEGTDSSVESLYFSTICRTFRSGGTRIRTGDTMIFSHMQKPLGMRKTRIGKRIYVQGVLLDTSWFCPYCCATVDMALLTSRGTGSRTRTSARLTHLLGYSGPPLSFGDVSGRNHKETYASCVDSPASSTFNASRSVSSRGSAERDKERKPRSGLEPLTCSSYEFACARSSPSYCVRFSACLCEFRWIGGIGLSIAC